MSSSWRPARSLLVLRGEIDTRWPGRSKRSDGMVGDLEHQSRGGASDHNPNWAGVVRAMDITCAGIDGSWYAEHLRDLGAAGHPALRNGGVVIYNRRVASSTRGWSWRAYTGANAHDHHVHVSVSKDPAGYDSTAPWGITTNDKDTFMPALTHDEQREILDRLRRLEEKVAGTDTATRSTSIWWRVQYIHDELLDGDNKVRLRRILAKFGV